MTLTRLAAIGVGVAAVTSLVVLWGLFFTMWLAGETSITVYADRFGEFWIEFVGLTLAIVFLPLLIYEIDRQVIQQ